RHARRGRDLRLPRPQGHRRTRPPPPLHNLARRGRRHRLHRDHRLTRLIFLPSSFSFLLPPPASPEPSPRKRMIKRKENDSSLRLPPLRPAAPLRLRAFALKFVSKVRLQPTLATKSAKDAEP